MVEGFLAASWSAGKMRMTEVMLVYHWIRPHHEVDHVVSVAATVVGV
jgi:hypothetical protein